MLTIARGVVKEWNEDEGWGIITSPGLADDVWAGFSSVPPNASGYRQLAVGAAVEFEYLEVPGGQDGYRYRTDSVTVVS